MSDYVGISVPSLMSDGQRPIYMTAAFVSWLRQHFIDEKNIENPDLIQDHTKFLWTADFATSTISIESISRWDPALVENRPALIVKRNKWTHMRLGVDNRYLGYANPKGITQYCNAWTGSHTIFVLSGEGAECEVLTAEVYRELNQFAPVMRRALDLSRLQVAEVGDIRKLEEATENYVIPITIAYAFFETWTLTPASPPLRAVRIQ